MAWDSLQIVGTTGARLLLSRIYHSTALLYSGRLGCLVAHDFWLMSCACFSFEPGFGLPRSLLLLFFFLPLLFFFVLLPSLPSLPLLLLPPPVLSVWYRRV